MSSTNVVAVDGITGWSGSTERPDFMILPGAYITELPPSTAVGSTTDQVCVGMSSTWLTIGVSVRGGREHPPVRKHEHVRVEREL